MDNEKYAIIKQFWQSRALKEEYLWAKFTHLTFEVIKPLIQQGSNILDLGAGDCYISNRLVDELSCNVTAVDYIDKYLKQFNGPNKRAIVSDIRELIITDNYDTVLMLGISSYNLDDQLLARLYNDIHSKCRSLIVKHQCHKYQDTIIDKYSEELNDRYISIYRTIESDIKLLKIFNKITVSRPYPPQYNKHQDSEFIMYYCQK